MIAPHIFMSGDFGLCDECGGFREDVRHRGVTIGRAANGQGTYPHHRPRRRKGGFLCPVCGESSSVVDSRPSVIEGKMAIWRRRKCDSCGHLFTTYEIERKEPQRGPDISEPGDVKLTALEIRDRVNCAEWTINRARRALGLPSHTERTDGSF